MQIVISWTAVFLWMIVIFYLSSQTAQVSNRFSRSMTSIIVKIIALFSKISIETSTMQNWFDMMNNTVREYAHGTIFFILVLLVCNAFLKSGLRGWKLYTFALVFCAIFACLDELHQIFVQGRGAEFKDFLMDCTGAIMGLVLHSIITWSLGIRKHKSYI
jgi:VanZ family protein